MTTATSSRWQIFSAAPHRMMMFGGAVQLLLTMLFWSYELTGRYTGLWSPLETSIPTTFAHAFLMLYSLLTFFFFGFLMTTYPRWMNGDIIPESRYSTVALVLYTGILLFYVGLFVNALLLSAGVIVFSVGFLLGFRALWTVFRTAPTPDKFYETILNTALLLGGTGMLAFAVGSLSNQYPLTAYSLVIGIWWFLIPVAITVCHRMLPFFTSCVIAPYTVYQPRSLLLAMLALSFVHGLFELLQLHSLLWLIDLPLALLAFNFSYRWGFRASFTNRLLAVLHIAYLWLGIALTLYTFNSLAQFLDLSFSFGRGPLHALMIGFLVSLTIAMASRVTLGHSGRELKADTQTWLIFLGISLISFLRILGELVLTYHQSGTHIQLLAALLWVVILLPWVSRYGSYYLRPRADGKMG